MSYSNIVFHKKRATFLSAGFVRSRGAILPVYSPVSSISEENEILPFLCFAFLHSQFFWLKK